MILDTSAIMAIVLGESDAPAFSEAIRREERVALSAASWLEATIVAGRRSEEAATVLEMVIARIQPEIVSVTAQQIRLAREGWQRFGKGRHPAKLNFGDCFSYALAIERDEALLFKGDDFSQTDVKKAL